MGRQGGLGAARCRVTTKDLIFSEEQQIFSEGFLSRHVYRHMSESSEQIWSVTVSTTDARHNHGALQACSRPVTAHCDLAPVQSAVRASRQRWIRVCQYSVQIINVNFCVSVPRSLNRPVLLVQ
jgi:hypothetical protein